MDITTNAIQVCGGAGYMKDYPLEKFFRDAKITQIYEGSNQVLRSAIASGAQHTPELVRQLEPALRRLVTGSTPSSTPQKECSS